MFRTAYGLPILIGIILLGFAMVIDIIAHLDEHTISAATLGQCQ